MFLYLLRLLLILLLLAFVTPNDIEPTIITHDIYRTKIFKDTLTLTMTESTPNKPPKTYPCPRCSTQTVWQDNKYKPFCSKQCKLIDLGAWANEDYTLPAETTPFSDEL